MRITFKQELKEKIQHLIKELEKTGVTVINEGQHIETSEDSFRTFEEDTVTIVKKFSANITFVIPEELIEVEME